MASELTREQSRVIEEARQTSVDRFRIIFLDYNGLSRARSLPVNRLEDVFQRGVNFSSPTVDFNSRDFFPLTAAFDLASPDIWAAPDPTTYRPAPGAPGVVDMLADLVQANGDPWAGCPRTALQAVIRRAGDAGVGFRVGFEPEGYVFRDIDGIASLAGSPQFSTLDGLDLHPGFMQDVLSYLQAAEIKSPQWSEEYGPGQIEVNLPHDRPLQAADTLIAFKHAFRVLARHHGLLGTFMPKPFEEHAGSGLHVHLSATPVDDPHTNLFDDSADTELGLSSLGRHILGGVLHHGEALTALGASTVNSYKRFLPGSWAPTHVMYAYASRAAFVRIPERETPRRIELRVGDPACNPYIYLTSILAAALDGMERRLNPGMPVRGNVATLDDATAQGARPLPLTLDRALEAMEQDDVVRSALGPIIAGEYIKVKRSEWDAFSHHVDEWDRAWYLKRY